IGLVIGRLAVAVRARLHNPVLTTATSFAVPFLAYLPAEYVGASGVLSVVLAGLVTGHHGARVLTAQDRISERLNWHTIQFVLENGVFLLLGVELQGLVQAVEEDQLGVGIAVLIGLLISAVLIVVRLLVTFALVGTLRRDARRAARQGTRLDAASEQMGAMRERLKESYPDSARVRERVRRWTRFLARRRADVGFAPTRGLDWRGGAVLGWSGMRGVVTLAAAQTLPRDLPYRPQLVLVAFTVAFVTLLLQGGTLPAVIRWLQVQGGGAREQQQELAGLLEEITDAGLSAISDENLAATGDDVNPEVLERVRREARTRLAAARETDEHGPDAQYRMLRRRALDAERAALLEARSIGPHSSDALPHAQHVLDQEETRLMGRSEDSPAPGCSARNRGSPVLYGGPVPGYELDPRVARGEQHVVAVGLQHQRLLHTALAPAAFERLAAGGHDRFALTFELGIRYGVPGRVAVGGGHHLHPQHHHVDGGDLAGVGGHRLVAGFGAPPGFRFSVPVPARMGGGDGDGDAARLLALGHGGGFLLLGGEQQLLRRWVLVLGVGVLEDLLGIGEEVVRGVPVAAAVEAGRTEVVGEQLKARLAQGFDERLLPAGEHHQPVVRRGDRGIHRPHGSHRPERVGQAGVEHCTVPGDPALDHLLPHHIGLLQSGLRPGGGGVLDLHR